MDLDIRIRSLTQWRRCAKCVCISVRIPGCDCNITMTCHVI